MSRRQRRSSLRQSPASDDGSPADGSRAQGALAKGTSGEGSPAVAAGRARAVDTTAVVVEDMPPAASGRRQRVAAYGLCSSPDGLVLLVRAARTLTVGGQWFLPGGGIQHGEDPVAGLRREFTEETGLEVEVGDLRSVLSDTFVLPDGTDLHTVRIIYTIDEYRGTLRYEVGGSSDAARWVTRDEAMALPLRPYVRDVLAELSS